MPEPACKDCIMNDTNQNIKTLPPVADGEWMMIHCDTFITDRERILLKERAFMIDRDLDIVKGPITSSAGDFVIN